MTVVHRPESLAKTAHPVTSNIEPGIIDAEIVKLLQSGQFYAQHAAWDFCGYIWWDADASLWREEVWCHHVPVGWHSSESLDNLIREVNNQWGWE